VHTLFPSPKTEEGIKGGVVLLRLRPPNGLSKDAAPPLRLAVTYSDREGKQFKCAGWGGRVWSDLYLVTAAQAGRDAFSAQHARGLQHTACHCCPNDSKMPPHLPTNPTAERSAQSTCRPRCCRPCRTLTLPTPAAFARRCSWPTIPTSCRPGEWGRERAKHFRCTTQPQHCMG